MSERDSLDAELANWQTAGRQATFWWRDDDASKSTPALDRLLDISSATSVPVALAVVPAWLHPSLNETLSRHDANATVLQHGWNHTNHARGSGDKGAWELGLHRGLEAVIADLTRGHGILQSACANHFVPVVTPPWNKIARALLPELTTLNYCGVSTFGARDVATAPPGLTINNCHCDPVDWKAGASFRGAERTLTQLVAHLRDRRLGAVDAGEATGLLTHHLDMDDETWAFTQQLLAQMAVHPAVRILSAREVFAP